MDKVVIGVLKSEFGFALLERAGGVKTFPGGKVEQGESLSEAVLREIDEEVGIQAEVVVELGSRERDDTVLTYFFCRAVEGKLTLKEPEKFKSVKWLSPEGIINEVGDSLFEPVRNLLEQRK